MSFIPLVYEQQKCYIIFSDPLVGEFQYEIVGRVDLPLEVIDIPKPPLTPPIFVDEPRLYPLHVPFKNDGIRVATKEVEKWMVEKGNRRG
jgi:hypothetical protein